MSDQKLRELERRSAEGDVEAEASLLRERVRAKQLQETPLQIAAFVGHPAARRALPPTGPLAGRWHHCSHPEKYCSCHWNPMIDEHDPNQTWTCADAELRRWITSLLVFFWPLEMPCPRCSGFGREELTGGYMSVTCPPCVGKGTLLLKSPIRMSMHVGIAVVEAVLPTWAEFLAGTDTVPWTEDDDVNQDTFRRQIEFRKEAPQRTLDAAEAYLRCPCGHHASTIIHRGNTPCEDLQRVHREPTGPGIF